MKRRGELPTAPGEECRRPGLRRPASRTDCFSSAPPSVQSGCIGLAWAHRGVRLAYVTLMFSSMSVSRLNCMCGVCHSAPSVSRLRALIWPEHHDRPRRVPNPAPHNVRAAPGGGGGHRDGSKRVARGSLLASTDRVQPRWAGAMGTGADWRGRSRGKIGTGRAREAGHGGAVRNGPFGQPLTLLPLLFSRRYRMMAGR